jgi:hypothetical protein
MRSWNILWMIAIAISMAGCIPDPLPVNNIEKPTAKIVVSSQMVPGVGLVVFVTKSVGALEAGGNSDPVALLQQIAIANASVSLTHQGNSQALQNLGNGLYGGLNATFLSGEEYTLKVIAGELGTVTAVTTVPQRVPFATVDVKPYRTGYDSLLQIDYSLNDPPGKNFYMISVQKFSQKQDLQSVLNPRMFLHLTDDTGFEGKHFENYFRTLFRSYSKGDSVSVMLASVGEDYYNFLKLRNDRFRFSEFSSEPLNYPSNVQGGYGYFNLHVPDARVFVVE